MHYRVERFKMKHFDNFEIRDPQKKDFEVLSNDVRLQEMWEQEYPMFTLFAEDKPIMLYGMINGGLGTYFPMAFVSQDVDKHLRTVIRCMYDYLDHWVANDMRRFEARVAVDDIPAMRFIEFFGFEPIGISRQSSASGCDQVIYERLARR